jgi:undecaprenyl-phosphate 4-deoxy-4-formamido-L-arabinose transferase
MLTYFGLLTAFCGFVLSVYIIIKRFFCANGELWSASGVLTAIAAIYVFTGVQMIGIGVIGEYIGRIYTDVRARPRYFIESILGRKDNDSK